MNTPWALLRVEDLPALPGGGGAAPRWWRFGRPAAVLRAARPEDVPRLLDEVEAATGGGGATGSGGSARWAVGFVAYEAASGFDRALVTQALPPGVPAAWFGLFDPPEASEGPAGSAEAAPGGNPPARAPALAADQDLVASLSEAEYLARLAVIRRAIERGETYQVNFTYRLRGVLGAAGAGAGWDARVLDLFGRLDRAQASPYAACLWLGDAAVCSVSPELFFRRSGRRIECRPMKGTAPRGRTGEEDRRLAATLSASVKERAENLMIVDMVRNDLGRVARPGSVKVPALFEVERYDTVLQMTSRVEAQSAATLSELFGALFPCASVTGAPKVSTMGLVAALEDSPRGVYTGAVGVVAPGGDARFSVAIRTAWVERRAVEAEGPAEVRIEYGTGGGIVWDSDPRRELAETRLKAVALHRALEAPAPDFELLETLLWTPAGGYHLLARHLARLAASADYFGFPGDLGRVRRRLEEAARETRRSGDGPRRVRLLCDRRGRVRVESAPLADPRRPLRVALAASPVDSGDVFLCHKTTRRQVYERALAEARSRVAEGGLEIDDVVLWNERGELTETTIANLVLEVDGEALTPPVECGLLAGTCRAELLARGRVRERVLTRGDLERAERVVLVNSVRGRVTARLPGDGAGQARPPRRRPVQAGGL
jgi:para-aminobenzoate synthetase/4-amino-4-deoxychorismate lyase